MVGVVARAWRDPAFKRRLLADPATALREGGVAAPAGTGVRVVEDTARLAHHMLATSP
jgi:hypothetical protein